MQTIVLISVLAGALLKIGALLAVVAVVVVVWQLRHGAQKISAQIERLHGDVQPLIHRVTSIAEDVNHVTTSIRKDVEKVNATIADGNERVREAMDATERRLREFNALLEVVQDEAEQLFISSAATLRGVRSGALALGRRGGPEFAVEGDGGVEDEDAADSDNPDELEMHDGDDRSTEPTENGAAYPRVRPRARRQG